MLVTVLVAQHFTINHLGKRLCHSDHMIRFLNLHRYAHARPLFFRPCCAMMRLKYSVRVAQHLTFLG